ncbi:MAG: sensor histidine kinase [Planctomycetota bacterium]|jgi:signal transduction histidine kinase
MTAARVLERLLRLVAGVGSYADASTAVTGIVRDIVDELGVEGAAVWQRTHDGYDPLACHGAPVPDELVLSADRAERTGGGCRAWPLRANRGTVGIFAVRGALSGPVGDVVRMLATRCAHILEDGRRAGAQRAVLEGLGHELRAPLQSLLGYVDLLQGGTFGPLAPDQAGALASIAGNAERILSVTRDVLQVARIDSGHETVIVGEVDLDDLIRKELDAVRPLAAEAGLGLACECPSDLRTRSDGRKIARILTNLLTNAVKYTSTGNVTVRAGKSPTGVFVEVADTGPGIPPERQADVFEEYVRLDAAQEGTGLGLAIARRLADLVGGRLTLHSTVGAGTTVRLDLPPRDEP